MADQALNYEAMSMDELSELAKKRGIKIPASSPNYESMSVDQLRDVAKQKGIKVPDEGPMYTMKSGERIPIMTGFPLAAALPESIMELLPAAAPVASDVGSTGGILSKAAPEVVAKSPGLLSKGVDMVTKKIGPTAIATAAGGYLGHKLKGLLSGH